MSDIYAGDRFKFPGVVEQFMGFGEYRQLVMPGGFFLAPWPGPIGEVVVEGEVLAFTSNCKAVCLVEGKKLLFPTEVIWSAIRARRSAEAAELVHMDGNLTREEAVELMAAQHFRSLLTGTDDLDRLVLDERPPAALPTRCK